MPDHPQRRLPTVAVAAGMAAAALLVLVAAAFLVVESGVYDVAGDRPHTKFVVSTLETLRDRSIAAHAKGIVPPPDLGSDARTSRGAGLYAEMCSGCHLAPGMAPTELSQGLYPAAPVFARGVDVSAAQAFWTIKHGVKMTAMPAWGRTHDDELIWDMTAFLRTLPRLNPAQYAAAVKSAPADHDEMMQGEAMKRP